MYPVLMSCHLKSEANLAISVYYPAQGIILSQLGDGGFVSRGIVLQLLGGMPLQSIGQQSTTIADEIKELSMMY